MQKGIAECIRYTYVRRLVGEESLSDLVEVKDEAQQVDQVGLERLRVKCGLAAKLWGRTFSALTAMTFREKGEDAIHKLWFLLLTSHQGDHYREGLKKLGIQDDPPAVAAAKYHYFTNIIGGLDMEYVEESPRKVWLRYKAPMWTYAGVAMIALPGTLRRTILSSWHPRNGIYMGCPRLGYVGTKFIMEGEPYDEGYFVEYDHDLGPDEIMRYEVVNKTPEFEPAQAPKLDPVAWPEARILKARRNFAGDYVRTTVDVLLRLYGEAVTYYIVQQAIRCVAVQYVHELKYELGIEGNDTEAITQLLADLLDACAQDFEIEKLSDKHCRIVLKTFKPFDSDVPEDLREAMFGFQRMGVRILNGHLNVARHSDQDRCADNIEVWEIEDKGRWLW
jgi:hypothetical protein